MKKIHITTLLALVTILLSSCGGSACKKEESDSKQLESYLVFEKGEKLPNTYFTGNAWLHPLIDADDVNRNSVGSVTFEPGARTYWHSHPAGQIILAIEGVGYYQEKGKPIEIIHKGQAVKCPHNIPHWHGASLDSKFIQVAITGRENGQVVWMEAVSDEEYKLEETAKK